MRLTISIMSAWVVGAFLALPASGVEVAADGFGQVLLYPYYTIRGSPNAFNTLISIGNSTPDVKAVRLRFHEAREGAPVGDFNIYLNAYAVWTGAVFATADGAGLASADHSCTRPIVSSDAVDPTPFNNASYLDSPDGGSLDRTREGYFEVIEMGDYGPLNTATPGSIAQAVSHDDDAQPIPANCALIAQDTGAQATAPTGGLFGSALLISVLGGVDYFYAATALSHYTDTRSGFGTPGPGTPSLADAQPPVSVVVDDMGRTIRSQWSRGIDAVSAALTSVKLQGEFVLDAGTKSGSEWVVTFPTKWYYIHAGALVAAPFQSDFLSGGECERILNLTSSGVLYDRESDFQPIPIGLGEPLTRGLLCFATQSVDFNASGVLGAATRYTSTRLPPMNYQGLLVPYQDGWMSVPLDTESSPLFTAGDGLVHRAISGASTVFEPNGAVTSRPQMTYFGLAGIGFAISSYSNGTLIDTSGRNVLSTYISGAPLHGSKHVE